MRNRLLAGMLLSLLLAHLNSCRCCCRGITARDCYYAEYYQYTPSCQRDYRDYYEDPNYYYTNQSSLYASPEPSPQQQDLDTTYHFSDYGYFYAVPEEENDYPHPDYLDAVSE